MLQLPYCNQSQWAWCCASSDLPPNQSTLQQNKCFSTIAGSQLHVHFVKWICTQKRQAQTRLWLFKEKPPKRCHGLCPPVKPADPHPASHPLAEQLVDQVFYLHVRRPSKLCCHNRGGGGFVAPGRVQSVETNASPEEVLLLIISLKNHFTLF